MAAIVDEANNVDLIALSDGLKKQLPPYAKPIFLRLLNTVEMTGNNITHRNVYFNNVEIILVIAFT